MTKATSLKQVNKAINAKFPGVYLVHGNGYYYITSDDDKIGTAICGLYTSSIGVFSIKQQTVETWVNDVQSLLNDEQRSEYDRSPVVLKQGVDFVNDLVPAPDLAILLDF